MAGHTIEYQLRIRNTADSADALTVTSVAGGTNPYLAGPPVGDGASFNPKTGESLCASYSGRIVDAITSGTSRIVTAALEDGGGRQQLGYRKAFVEQRLDGGAWVTLCGGYLTLLRLVDAATWEWNVQDASRAAKGATAFGASDATTMATFLATWPQRGCIFGGPVIGSFLGMQDFGGWVMRWDTGPVSGCYYLRPVNVYGPPNWTPNDNIANFADAINKAVSKLHTLPPGKFATTSWSTIRDAQVNAWSWSGLTLLVDGVPWRPIPFTNFPGAITVGVDDTGILVSAEKGKAGLCVIRDGQAAPTIGATVRVRCLTILPTELSPIYYDGHPIDLLQQVWTLAGRSYDAGACATLKNTIGAQYAVALRVADLQPESSFLQSTVLQPFGVGLRIQSSGALEPFSTRLFANTPPATTITDADVVQGETTLPFELDPGSGVSQVKIQMRLLQALLATTGSSLGATNDNALDAVVTSSVNYTLYSGDASAVPSGVVTIDLPGMIHKVGSFRPVDPTWFEAIAAQFFDRFARGALAGETMLLREPGGTTDGVKLGDEILVSIAQLPNHNKRLGDDLSVAARAMQVVRLTELPQGRAVRLLDSGPNLQPLATVPTLTIARSSDSPRRVAEVTVTNAAALNALGYGVRVQMATTTGAAPASGDYTDVLYFRPGVVPTTATRLPIVVAGRTVYVRARSELVSGGRPSNYGAAANVALLAIDNPTSVTAAPDGTDGSLCALAWVIGANAAADLTDIWLRLNGEAFAVAHLESTLPAGSTQFTVRSLTPGVAYIASVQHRDPRTLDTSSPIDVAFTAGASLRVLTAPIHARAFAGSLDKDSGLPTADGTYGIAMVAREIPGAIEIAVATETAVGSGLYTAFDTVARVPSVQGDWTIGRLTAPNDGKRRQIEARHVGDGVTTSAYTDVVTVQPWTVVPLPLFTNSDTAEHRLSRSAVTFDASAGKVRVWYRFFSTLADGTEVERKVGTVWAVVSRTFVITDAATGLPPTGLSTPTTYDTVNLGYQASWDSTNAQGWNFALTARASMSNGSIENVPLNISIPAASTGARSTVIPGPITNVETRLRELDFNVSELKTQSYSGSRPFSSFGVVGTADDTATIQSAVDWSAAGNGSVGEAGTFIVDNLVIKNGARIVCPGVNSTFFVAKSGSANPMFILDSGPVQNVTLEGFALVGRGSGNAGQHAIYFHSNPILVDGALQGGLWYSTWRNISIPRAVPAGVFGLTEGDPAGFDGESVWLHGGKDTLDGPHQFAKWEGVVVEATSTTKRALRMSGQVGQMDFDGACRFDGPGRGVGTVNILIERSVNNSGVNDGDVSPYSINLPITSQSNTRLVTIERGLNITLDYAHFEEANEGVYIDVSSNRASVQHSYFANVGNNSGAGWAVKSNSGNATVGNNTFAGTTDTHYIRSSGGTLTLRGGDTDATGIRTTGATLQLATAATINAGYQETVFINGGSATIITTITSQLAVGKYLSLRSNGGRVYYGTGGNIDLGGYSTPILVPSGETITLVRNDLSGTWQIVGISGPRGAYYHLPVFITVADSPYTVPPDVDTVRVDATGGNVTVKLPSISLIPAGKRVQIKKIDSSSNSVFINGALTAENPDGQADNVVKLTKVTQAKEVQRSATTGSGAWDTVNDGNTPVQVLTFGTHLTGGSFDGSAPVTIGTDATSANTASAIVARDASGRFSSGRITIVDAGIVNPLIIDITDANGSAMEVRRGGTTRGYFGADKAGQLVTGSADNDIVVRAESGAALYLAVNSGNTVALKSTSIGAVLVPFTFRAGAGTAGGGGTAGDIIARRSATTGAYYFGELSNAYLYWDGSSYYFGSSGAGVGGIVLNGGDVTMATAYGITWGATRIIAYDTGTTILSLLGGSSVLKLVVGADPGGSQQFRVGGGAAFGGAITVSQAASAYGLNLSDTSGNTGIQLKPNASGDSAFLDVSRVGALLIGRVSNASATDRTWLSVAASGIATLAYGITANATINAVLATSGYALSIEDTTGNTGISLKPHASGDSGFIDNVRVGGVTVLRTSSASGTDTNALTLAANGAATFAATIKTVAPASGAGAWKLGKKINVAGPLVLDTTNYIEIEDDGATIKLAIVN